MDPQTLIIQTFQKYLRAANENDGPAAARFFSAHSTIEIFYYEAGAHKLVDEVMGPELINYVVRHLLPFRSDLGIRRLSTDHIVEIQDDLASMSANFLVIATKSNGAKSDSQSGSESVVKIIRSGTIRTYMKLDHSDWRIIKLSVFDDGPPPVDGETITR